MEKSNEASYSIFGWQFQISASIYLMIKYFGKFKRLKVESTEEDIEIELENGKKIYAQAKSAQTPLKNNNDHSQKLKKYLIKIKLMLKNCTMLITLNLIH